MGEKFVLKSVTILGALLTVLTTAGVVVIDEQTRALIVENVELLLVAGANLVGAATSIYGRVRKQGGQRLNLGTGDGTRVRSPVAVGVLALLLGALVLTGCPAGNVTYETERGAVIDQATKACQTYRTTARSLGTLIIGGSLTASQIDQVEGLDAVVGPICERGVPPDATTARAWLKEIQQALDELLLLEAEAKR